MSLRGFRSGATVIRVYYSVPINHGVGETFDCDEWGDAVDWAHAHLDRLVRSLEKSLGDFATKDVVYATANAQIRVDLRWVIRDVDGSEIDTVVESFGNVAKLGSYV